MSSESGFDTARLARILMLIAIVSAVFLFLGVEQLEGDLLRIGVVAIGAIAVVTAITGFLIAGVEYSEHQGNP